MMTKECYILRNVETRAYFNKALLRNHNCEFNTCLMFLDQKKKKKNPSVRSHESRCLAWISVCYRGKVVCEL